MKRNFLFYTMVPMSWSCIEYPESSSGLKKIVSLKTWQKTQVFKGCHSNGYRWRREILHVNSRWLALHFTPLHPRSISNSLGAMAENVIFRRFWAKNRPFWASYHSNEQTNQLFAANIIAQGRGLHVQGVFGAIYPSVGWQDFENLDFWRKSPTPPTSEANISKSIRARSNLTEYRLLQITWSFEWCHSHGRTTNNKLSVWGNVKKWPFLAIFSGLP